MKRGRWSWLGPTLLWLSVLVWDGVSGGSVAAFLTYGLGLVLGYVWLLPLLAMRSVQLVRVVTPDRELAGAPIGVELQVRFRSWLPPAWLTVKESWTSSAGGEGAAAVAFERKLGPGWSGRLHVRYTLEGLTRGVYRCSATELIFGDPFGWMVCRRLAEAPGQVTVYPRPALARQTGSAASAHSTGEPLGRQGAGRHARGNGLREYVPGDSLRWIHWKTTARRGALHTVEREAAAERRQAIVLDGAEPGRERVFDGAVEAVAGLWQRAEESGLRPGFVWAGDPPAAVPPGGRLDRPAMFARLAELPSRPPIRPVAELLLQLGGELPQAAPIIAVTTRLQTGLVAAIRRLRLQDRPITLLLVTEREPAGETAARLRELEAAGCSVAVVTLPEGWEVEACAVDDGA